MFVRRKRNRSGTTSVVVVDKSSGKFKELTTIGVSSCPEELDELERKACAEYKSMLSNVDRTLLNMPQTILNSIYNRIGFNAMDDDILRHLVVARVCQPMSKVATVDYLKSYFDEDVLRRIPKYELGQKDFSDLLPGNWSAAAREK